MSLLSPSWRSGIDLHRDDIFILAGAFSTGIDTPGRIVILRQLLLARSEDYFARKLTFSL
jgi:hypothetical protein